jgi:acetyl esterase/lipase
MRRLGFITVIVLSIVVDTDAGMIRDALQKRAEGRNITSNTMMDVAYGSDKKQRLDVYLPTKPQNSPVIVMVHGGAWSKGDKRMDRVVENKAARWNPKGVIFVSLNYRLLPDANPLKQADDVANALAYVQNNAIKWGGDPTKIVLMGHSAGAHLVSLVSSDPTQYPALKPWLGTVSLDSAAMNIPKVMSAKHYDFYDEAFGADPTLWEAASPYHRLSSKAVPMMLVCSSQRPDKPCEEMEGYVQKAKSLGLYDVVQPEAMSHKEINEELGLESDYTKAVEAFIRSLGVSI